MVIKSTNDISLVGTDLKCLVLGDAGTGKSIFASSFPGKAFVFDFDLGILSYEGTGFDYAQYECNQKGWQEFEKDFRDIVIRGEGVYKTIIFDSLTKLTEMAMENSLAANPQRSPSGGPVFNIHYPHAMNLIEGKLRKLISYKGNVVCIGHIKSVKDDVTGALTFEPIMIGQLAKKLASNFDEVYYAITRKKGKEVEWLLQTVSLGWYNARSRLSGKARRIPDFIPNDYPSLMNCLAENTSVGETKEKGGEIQQIKS